MRRANLPRVDRMFATSPRDVNAEATNGSIAGTAVR
jgi:hypothetical protein